MFESVATRKFNRNQALRLAAGTVAGAALLSACNIAPAVAASSPPVSLYLTLVSDAMTGKQNWPVYVPTDITLPAHSTINARIVQFDSGAGELPDGTPYAKVTGVLDGSATRQSITQTDPNNPGKPTTYQELASKDVAHTFTIGALGINVPLPVSSVVSFTFKTGDPGTYTFQCMVPCGTDPAGVGGPMQDKGYMLGSVRVV